MNGAFISVIKCANKVALNIISLLCCNHGSRLNGRSQGVEPWTGTLGDPTVCLSPGALTYPWASSSSLWP